MKIAILTNFTEFNPGYSLTGIVKDQVTMLKRYSHDVHLFVCEGFNNAASVCLDVGCCEVKPLVPFAHLADYQSVFNLSKDHAETVQRTAQFIVEQLADFDVAFTHDLIFTGWNLPYALGILAASKQLPSLLWLHWIHSIPSNSRDWWHIKKYGPNHRIVYPNRADAIHVAERYRGTLEDIKIIPHIKDPRTWWDFDEGTCEFIDEYPAVMQADFVQILPASADRLHAKRVGEVIHIMSNIKIAGKSVCLVVANQWATERIHGEDITSYKRLARACDLSDREVIFTSEFKAPTFKTGIPRRMLRELFLLSNLFIFPTDHESFGLVVPEAALSGTLMLLNRSLDNQQEITGGNALYFPFSSYNNKWECPDMNKYCQDLATIILGRWLENEAIRTKTFCRQRYNMDSLYRNYYSPIIADLKGGELGS
jgi:glycosyltransferase involved in cell wall biosynthesis